MKPHTPDASAQKNANLSERASGGGAEMEALWQRMAALEARLAADTSNPSRRPTGRPGSLANVGVLLASVAVIGLGGAGIVYGEEALKALFIDDTGKVGIGTEQPNAKLDVAGTLNVRKSANVTGTLTTGGNVSIGTNDPKAMLDVAGKLNVGDSANVTGSLTTGGNVGIGVTGPSARLHVNGGDFKVTNGNNYFWYDGRADVWLRSEERGNGGRALVHGEGDKLVLNWGGKDFKGGVEVHGMTTVTGSLQYQGTYQLNNEPVTTRPISPRYHLTLTGPVYSGSSKKIPHETLVELCGDEDGCQVRLGMTKWSNDTATETASRSFLFYYASNGRWRSEYGDRAGVDGDGTTQHAADPWSMCHFTDGHYSKFANKGDSEKGMELLMWRGKKGEYGGVNRTCQLTLID